MLWYDEILERVVTEEELKNDYERFKKEDPESYDFTFWEYIQNCTSKNGMLTPVK